MNAWRSVFVFGIAIFFLRPALAQGQDVAEAARQEQERKSAQKNPRKHVYTEEDLKKDRILTPDDQAKVATKKQQRGPVPTEESVQNEQPSEQESREESLGQIARRYRQEKAAREAAEAETKNYTAFDYELPNVATASPKAEAAPLVDPKHSEQRINIPNLQPLDAPSAMLPVSSRRVSPFQPRPLKGAPPTAHAGSAPAVPRVVPVPSPVPRISKKVDGGLNTALQPVQVQRGESWWKLAVRYLRSGTRWAELRDLNPGSARPANLLLAGDTIMVPSGKSVQVNSVGSGTQVEQITVKAGDTLWSLARKYLGWGGAWTCLASVNPQIEDYRRMAVGSVVQLPASDHLTCGVPKVTEVSGSR